MRIRIIRLKTSFLVLQNMDEYIINHCTNCGACCAYYRASFYWAEASDATEGGVPVEFTEQLGPFRRLLKGTGKLPPRCVALLGNIGESVRCTIYSRRASVCRDFVPSWLNGEINPRCDQARASWKLLPLLPDSWNFPGKLPHVA